MNDQRYQPLCQTCEEQGIERLATEERHGDPLCASCATSQDEAAYERMLDDHYGGSGPQSDRERFNVDSMKGRW